MAQQSWCMCLQRLLSLSWLMISFNSQSCRNEQHPVLLTWWNFFQMTVTFTSTSGHGNTKTSSESSIVSYLPPWAHHSFSLHCLAHISTDPHRPTKALHLPAHIKSLLVLHHHVKPILHMLPCLWALPQMHIHGSRQQHSMEEYNTIIRMEI